MPIWQEGSQDEEGEGKEEAVKGEPSKGQFEVCERTCRTGALRFNEVQRSFDVDTCCGFLLQFGGNVEHL